MDDWQLLKSYGRDDSQDAFTEIVRRHVNLVYSAALRQVREAELARDVTQVVFANLARRAKSLKPKGTLAGWLYRDASLTSREILRRERRRVVREQEAVAMRDTDISHDWARIRPGLDAALSRLGQTDRDAVLLRFFEQRSLKDVGAALGMEEDTARKRVSRALEKLRMQLARQGSPPPMTPCQAHSRLMLFMPPPPGSLRASWQLHWQRARRWRPQGQPHSSNCLV